MRVAVNVSYRQFLGDDLAESVRDVLDEFDLPGSALELEFTERVLIEDAPDTLKTFAKLRDLGVVLTIDDFGEGYSALNYLRRLPIHGLKLSQLFVEGVPGNKSDVAVCQAVAGIARSLGLGPGRRRRGIRSATRTSCSSSACRSARASCSRRACRRTNSPRRLASQARDSSMPEAPVRIRPIEARDDAAMAAIIRTVMPEFGAVGDGFAINDPEVDWMSRAYADSARGLFRGRGREARVLGGGGVAPLVGGDADTCELRKMYFLPGCAVAAPARR